MADSKTNGSSKSAETVTNSAQTGTAGVGASAAAVNGRAQSTVINPVLSTLKLLGRKIAERCLKEGKLVAPVLAAFNARCMTLQHSDRFDLERGLTIDQEEQLIAVSLLGSFNFLTCAISARG